MWMMGCNDGGDFNNNVNIQDPFNPARKLRPLMPRPASASASTNPPNCIHGTDHLLALNHHLAVMAEQNKSRELNRQQVVVSSRWNPTPEQLQTLEELYRRGTRTPSADEIQHITVQLRRYGKIEGKNVFYWFQNHKARERQKRRRRLDSLSEMEQQNEKPEAVAANANRTVCEVEQTKNWASPTNSSTAATEKTFSTQGAAAKAVEAEESKGDGWGAQMYADQYEEDLQLQRRNATWHMMHNLSCPTSDLIMANLINSSSSTVTSSTIINQSTILRSSGMEIPNHSQDFINNIISMEPYNAYELNLDRSSNHGEITAQTLELFPLQSTNQTLRAGYGHENLEESGATMSCSDTITPCQFFEFLPLKN